jgi:hypothetical protein
VAAPTGVPISEVGVKDVLESLYYDPRQPGSFGGVEALYKNVKSVDGAKTKSDIRKWFESQDTYALHKPSRKHFKRNVIVVHSVDEQFQADLADMSMLASLNKGVHFWLTCIDVMSKYAWVIPLRNKSAHTVMRGFQEIFSERKPLKLQTDHGTEFTNSTLQDYMRENGVHHFFTYNPDIKASIAERFNRTIKEKVYKYMTYKDTRVYIDVLQDLVHSYNNTYHRSVKMTPTEASLPENKKQVWRNLYGDRVRKIPYSRIKFKYRLGDYVRISVERDVFRKGYKQRWTSEVFRVVKQSPRDPVVYKLEDLDGEPIIGSFYEPELQRVSEPTEIQRRWSKPSDRDLDFYIRRRGYHHGYERN